MATPGPFFYVRADEVPLLRLRAAPAFFLVLVAAPLAVLALVLAAALVARATLEPARVVPAWAPWAVWGALVLLVAIPAWRRQATTEYALTDQRIYVRYGRLVTRLHFTTHDKVTDIHYRQGPIERLFGLASITFATAGGEVHVPGIRDALQVKEAAEKARDAFLRTLLGEAAPLQAPPEVVAPADAPSAPPPPAQPWTGARPGYLQAGDAPVWSARPVAVAAVGALRPLLGLVPLLIVFNLRGSSPGAPMAAAALVLVLAFVLVRVLQLRRMEYIATDRRVYARTGLVTTSVNQLTYDKITDIAYHQDLLGRLLGYGSVTLQTAGSNQAPIKMIGLGDPLAAKETIEAWRDRSIGGARR